MIDWLEKYLNIFLQGYAGYANYLFSEITHLHWKNYFYWLVGISLFFFLLEIFKPWRVNQAKFRKDFWLDFFYMFFNFFLFSLIIYNAASDVVVNLFNDILTGLGLTNLVAIQINAWPAWIQLSTLLIVRDFIHWCVHRLLHRIKFLWQFHKVHHSVEQMGFAAHLRYHWMENVVYRSLEYIPLAMIGFGIDDFFLVYIFSLAVGHFNHSNFKLNLGPFKYIFNNPQMHIWHHAYDLPPERQYGINFGLTLSIWDYMFGTAYIPFEGRDIRLGFPGVEKFPHTFLTQNAHGFGLSESEHSKK